MISTVIMISVSESWQCVQHSFIHPFIYAASGHRYVSPSSSKLMMETKKQMVISYKCHALGKGRSRVIEPE